MGTTRKQNPGITVEDSGISETKRGTPSSEQGESNVGSFLRSQRFSFTMSTHQMVTLLTRSTVFSVDCIMQCSANNLYPGSEVTGSCAMTMPPPTPPTLSRTSWLNIRSHKCCSPTVHHVTFLYSQRRNMQLRRNRFQDTEKIKNAMRQLLSAY